MIRKYIQEHRDEIVEVLKKLVAVPSVRSEAQENAPFGPECARALEVTEALYREYGFATDLHADKGYLLAHLPGSGEGSVGVMAHADVVPVGDDWIYSEPFAVTEKDGFLIGRGVDDNKAGIVASLYAARAIRDLGIPMQRSLVLFTGSNEESGMKDAQAYAREQPHPDVTLVPDNEFPVYHGEKSTLRYWADAPAAEGPLYAMEGGSAFNIVLGQATARLRDVPGLYDALKTAAAEGVTVSRDAEGILLDAQGLSRHASMPEGSVNAAKLLADTLGRCSALPEAQRRVMAQAAEIMCDPYGTGFGIAANDPAFGRFNCANGMVAYDGHLSLSFDIRYGTAVDGGELVAAIGRKLEGMGWTLRVEDHRAGYFIPEESPLVQRLLRTYEKCTGKTGCRGCLSAGGTYARCLPNAVSIGNKFSKPIPFAQPAGHGAVHQPDECISIDGLLEGMAVMTEMILACDTL